VPPLRGKARRLRAVQCRQGWHLEAEPLEERTKPTEEQTELMPARADLFAAYIDCKTVSDTEGCEQTPTRSRSWTTQSVPPGCGAGSPRSTLHRHRNAARPGAGRTRRTCSAGRSRSAPWAGCSAASTAVDAPDAHPRLLRPGRHRGRGAAPGEL